MVLPLLERCRAPSSICWSLWYLASVQRSTARTLRITHVWEDKLCVWRPKLDTLLAVTAPLRPEGCVPALLIQVHEAGEAGWLNDDRHNYSHLLRVAVPKQSSLSGGAGLAQAIVSVHN